MANETYPWGTPAQPGEWIAGCGHTPHAMVTRTAPNARNLWQWYELSKSVAVPGGQWSRWIVCCAACRDAATIASLAARPWFERVELREHWMMESAEESLPQLAERLRAMTDAEEIRACLEQLDDDELQALAVDNMQRGAAN